MSHCHDSILSCSKSPGIPMNSDKTNGLLSLWKDNPALMAISTPNSPLVLDCLKTLFNNPNSHVSLENAARNLSNLYKLHINESSFVIEDTNTVTARRELSNWIRWGLLDEREGCLYQTNDLLTIFAFLDELNLQSTSTQLKNDVAITTEQHHTRV